MIISSITINNTITMTIIIIIISSSIAHDELAAVLAQFSRCNTIE